MSKKLQTLYLALILDNRYIALRRRLAEVGRLLTMKKRVVTVFLQLDDPYSYLLSYYLSFAIRRYKKVEFRFIICQALRGDYVPEPAMLAEYAARDCALLARELGVPFLDVGSTPAVEHRRALLDFLAEEQDEEGFDELMIKALSVYWRGDAEGVARMLSRSYVENAETNVLIGKNQLLLRKMGHYNCATLHYAGEWYGGVDRLHYLLDMFERQKLNRYKEPTPELIALQQATQFTLPATPPAAAASLPPLDLYYSFRSPFSYLALPRAVKIASAFGVKLNIKPVLPLAMRGVPVPRPKTLYLVKDANREAKRLKIPFGKIADPLGSGAERCIAAYNYAVTQDKGPDFAWNAGQAIWSKAVDVSVDSGMEHVAERSGLFWPDVKEAMNGDDWREQVEKNRADLADIGLWGVPSFCIGDVSMWGQDREWLLVRQLEELCASGEGIME